MVVGGLILQYERKDRKAGFWVGVAVVMHNNKGRC